MSSVYLFKQGVTALVNKPQSKHDVRLRYYFLIRTGSLSNSNNDSNKSFARLNKHHLYLNGFDGFDSFSKQGVINEHDKMLFP